MSAPGSSRDTMLGHVVAHARAFAASPLQPDVEAKARMCLVDFLSCAFEAAPLPWSRQAAEVAVPHGNATIIADPRKKTTVDDAAFANAVAGHGLVREDMHAGSIAHLGVVVWPALLALAEDHRINGERFLRAAVVGYEIGGRLGRVVMTPEVARLFRPTGLVGPYAAALAGAMALGLDDETAGSAVALAANTSAGLNEWPHNGADEMYFHPGFAVRNAMRSLRLAQAGAWASPTIIEGPAGTVAAYARTALQDRLALFTDGDAEIMAVFNKQVPACNFAQSPCQAAVTALRKADVDSTAITKIRVDTYEAALNYPGCAHKGPFQTPLQAKMSIAFGVAAALARGEIAEANYAELDNAEIARLVGLVDFTIDRGLNEAFPQRQGTRVTLELSDGRSVSHAMDDIAFADSALIESRFVKAAEARLGKARAASILADIAGLKSLDDVSGIIRACGTQEGAHA